MSRIYAVAFARRNITGSPSVCDGWRYKAAPAPARFHGYWQTCSFEARDTIRHEELLWESEPPLRAGEELKRFAPGELQFCHNGVSTFYCIADVDAHDGLAAKRSSNLMPISLVRITISAPPHLPQSVHFPDQLTPGFLLHFPAFRFRGTFQRLCCHIGMATPEGHAVTAIIFVMARSSIINFKIQIQVVFFFISRRPILRARLFSTFTQTAVTTAPTALLRYNPACLQPPAAQSDHPTCIALRTDQRRSYCTTN